MYPSSPARAGSRPVICNWTCRLCGYSNPDDEDLCCQQCGAVKK